MPDKIDLSDVRRNYESHPVYRRDLHADPVLQFGLWLQQARDLDLLDATAMVLATSNAEAQPSSRVVLLKHFDGDGFCWYSDARSQKGRELAANPRAALLFHWRDLSRQVRIQGIVETLPADDAQRYFESRPEGSRFSAAASHQSAELASRSVLVDEVERLRRQHRDGKVARPASWIGYRLRPLYFEFWQGSDNRLHDRIVYQPSAKGWSKKRISP